MQFVRWVQKPAGHLKARSYATAFVPPSANRNIAPPPPPSRQKPSTSSFFTARSTYNDSVTSLQTTKENLRRALTQAHLLPISPKRRAILKPTERALWKPADKMSGLFGLQLRTGNYRQILRILNELKEYKSIAAAGNETSITREIEEFLSEYEREDKQLILSTKARPIKVDKYARTYALGRRKESSARVWVIPTRLPKKAAEAPVAETQPPTEVEVSLPAEALQNAGFAPTSVLTTVQSTPEKVKTLGSKALAINGRPALPALNPPKTIAEAQERAKPSFTPPVTEVLINNVPLATYFPTTIHREKVMLPFKVTGTVGKYNVFALVRGGGHTGQAGAIALGISKGLRILFPNGKTLLRKTNLLRRDPRMVERKKTGQPKARKRYTWVKR